MKREFKVLWEIDYNSLGREPFWEEGICALIDFEPHIKSGILKKICHYCENWEEFKDENVLHFGYDCLGRPIRPLTGTKAADTCNRCLFSFLDKIIRKYNKKRRENE